jgi:hypothetical protein
MTLAPIDLFSSFIHLHHGGQVHAEPQVFDPERDGWQLKAMTVTLPRGSRLEKRTEA